MESGDWIVRASKSAKYTDIPCVVGSFFQLLRIASWWSSVIFFFLTVCLVVYSYHPHQKTARVQFLWYLEPWMIYKP